MTKSIILRTLIAATSLTAAVASSTVADAAANGYQIGAMKPHHAMILEIGQKRAVSYFLPEGNACNLVLTIAEEPNFLEDSRFAATRFEATVQAGQATRYGQGAQAIEFTCHTGAIAMSAKFVGQIDVGSAEK